MDHAIADYHARISVVKLKDVCRMNVLWVSRGSFGRGRRKFEYSPRDLARRP